METVALPIELLACMLKRLASLLVQRMLLAPRAILLDLHTIRHVGLVLGGRVIATLAVSASQRNHSAHVSKTSIDRPWGTVVYDSIKLRFLSMPAVSPRLFCKRLP